MTISISYDEHPGGCIASYGAGLSGSSFTHIAIGVGRSPHDAVSDAMEQLATGLCFSDEENEQLDESLAMVPDTTEAVEEVEHDLLNEICKERFGRRWAGCTSEQQAEAGEVFSDETETVQLAAVVRLQLRGYK